MRLLRSGILIATSLFALPLLTGAQQQPQAQAPKDQMFSGVVTDVTPNSITAARVGSKQSITFLVAPDTKFEGGTPHVNSRVTVRYVTTDQGEKALRVIVRGPAKK